jgi:hypothetical protein
MRPSSYSAASRREDLDAHSLPQILRRYLPNALCPYLLIFRRVVASACLAEMPSCCRCSSGKMQTPHSPPVDCRCISY